MLDDVFVIDKNISNLNNSDKFKIELCGFDLKLIEQGLTLLRNERLKHTPWINRNHNGYPPKYGYDTENKKVRQVDSVLNYLRKNIK